ncbi:DnaD domain protein [Bacillus sp. Y1]|nr:DnaD domain protein [Bacillus sp. Y1]
MDTYVELVCEEAADTFTCRDTLREQNKKKKKEKEKQLQQKVLSPDIEKNSQIESPHVTQESGDVKEIIEFWDSNGFGFTNVNGKEQLLAWLDDSRFLQPKEIILKAMTIACANNKRKLNYVVGILKNWENESLLTVEEIDSYVEDQKPVAKQKQAAGSLPAGRDIPTGFVLDLTAGEK